MSAEESVFAVVELYSAILRHLTTDDDVKRRDRRRLRPRMRKMTEGEEERIRQRHAEGIGQERIAQELGRHQSSVWYRARKMGLKPLRTVRPMTDSEMIVIRDRYLSGMSPKRIGQEIGRSLSVVQYNVHKMGLKRSS